MSIARGEVLDAGRCVDGKQYDGELEECRRHDDEELIGDGEAESNGIPYKRINAETDICVYIIGMA